MRAISTVLDVSVCLLLISVAVATVAFAPGPPGEKVGNADETAAVLATSTATVEYGILWTNRTAHGTLAGLLARGAASNLTVGDTRLSPYSSQFRASVATDLRNRLVAPNRTRVVAHWHPYRGAPVSGRMAVGPAVPRGVDVAAATVAVPAPFESVPEEPATEYRSLGQATARSIIGTVLPSTALGAAAGRDSATSVVSMRRYRTIGRVLDVDEPYRGSNVSRAHARVTAALANRITADLREQFQSPSKARAALRTGTVRIVVRRWQP